MAESANVGTFLLWLIYPYCYGHAMLFKIFKFQYFFQFFLPPKTVKITEVCSELISIPVVAMVLGSNGETPTKTWEVEVTPKDEEGFEYKCSLPVKGQKIELTSEFLYQEKSEAEKAANEAISRFGSDY